jgi:hypothetical protein
MGAAARRAIESLSVNRLSARTTLLARRSFAGIANCLPKKAFPGYPSSA